MSVRIMSQIWDMTELSPVEKLALLALADWANDDGLAWPSIRQIATKTGCGERTVQRAFRTAETMGILTRIEVAGKGCKYKMHPRQPDTPAREAPPPHRRETPATLAPNTLEHTIKKKIDAHEIPNGWVPREFGAGTQSRNIVDGWPPGTLTASIEGFTAHHRARGNKFKDWQDAWSTWVLNSRKFENGRQQRAQNNSGGNGRPVDGFVAALRHVENGGFDEPFENVR